MKPERIQDRSTLGAPERLQQQGMIGDWQVDSTPNAITRHFPQPSYSASAAFLTKVAVQADQHDREVFAFVDASGVTVRLGNAPAPAATPGVTETDLELAVALTAIR